MFIGPCDIVGDLSYEELRAAAYDDAKRGLNLQSIVEKERNLLNSKLLEFENLVRNPFKSQPNSALNPQNPLQSGIQNAPVISTSSNPPAFSSFSQFGASVNSGAAAAAAPNSLFGQSNPFQNNSQTSSTFQTNSSSSGALGSFGSQFPHQLFGSHSSSFGSNSVSVQKNPFPTSATSLQISASAGDNSGPSSLPNGIGSSMNMNNLRTHTATESKGGDDSIWMKEEWSIGESLEELEFTISPVENQRWMFLKITVKFSTVPTWRNLEMASVLKQLFSIPEISQLAVLGLSPWEEATTNSPESTNSHEQGNTPLSLPKKIQVERIKINPRRYQE
ncbi:hypothetical protein M9H77_27863 [Catharanthus roseus]|uniref:Uncharacterized protein n=1 Tax=Catharanthus roseus TaxID=4058 RepID=A0ACC0AFD1_CATRO|nr:hypothetical protein M9H77_27863 [Catharanthus roseus]